MKENLSFSKELYSQLVNIIIIQHLYCRHTKSIKDFRFFVLFFCVCVCTSVFFFRSASGQFWAIKVGLDMKLCVSSACLVTNVSHCYLTVISNKVA